MNQLKFIILIFFLMSNYSYSQKEGKLYYKKINVNGKVDTSILIFDENQSYFYTIMDKAITKPFRDEDGTVVRPSNTIDSIANKKLFVYYDRNKDTFYLNNINQNKEIIISMNQNNTNWVLTDETKNIGEYLCYKAQKQVGGKNYTAWYTEQIEFPYGPISINGLKGIILELYNEDETVNFIFEKFENTKEFIEPYIKEYDFEKSITFKEYQESKTN